MKIELTPEQIQFKDEVREFVKKEIMPYAEINDRQERIPIETFKLLAERNYLGSMLSKDWGGLGLDSVTLGILNEEMGRGCSSVRSILTVHGMVALAISRWGTRDQKEKWLPKLSKGELIGSFALTEPNVGSDAKSIETQAVESGGSYIINGHKKWITMGQISEVFLVFTQCEGKPTAFLVEKGTPGFNIKPMGGLMASRAAMIAELEFTDCKVPTENMIGKTGTGLTHVALGSLDYGRYSIACGCVGVAQACLDASIEYSRSRKQFGAKLREHQLIQKMITEMVVKIEAARLLCYKAGYLKDISDPDSIMQTWIAKYYASTILKDITSDAIQIHGANGCKQEYNVERYFREAKIMEIIEGTTQMHEVLIATNAFRQHRS